MWEKHWSDFEGVEVWGVLDHDMVINREQFHEMHPGSYFSGLVRRRCKKRATVYDS